MKSLESISWLVDEPTYRNDPALSYSTISTYERGGGFNSLPTLFDRKESPSLLLGSIVDCIITDGTDAFNKRYFTADFPECSDTIINIVKTLFENYKSVHNSLLEIPSDVIINITEQMKYQLNWKPETRAKVIKEKGDEYYKLLHIAGDKTIISTDMYNTAFAMVNALKTAPASKFLFEPNDPFDDNIQRFYQLKFKATINGIPYRIMMDESIVIHDKKKILPIDLKTSSKPEYDFYKSFLEWGYCHQAKLYTEVLRRNIEQDDYFKDFDILPYIFVVVNKDSLNPLCWEFKESVTTDDFVYGDKVIRSPLTIGEELYAYLQSNPMVPNGILTNRPNDIIEWINRCKM